MENTPLRRSDVQLSLHCYQSFGAVVPHIMTREQLIDPKLWCNVASKMRMNDEIRVYDDAGSFVATLFVTYAGGHEVRVRVISYTVFETEDVPTVEDEYFLKQRGTRKWCLMKKGVSDAIFENIPTKHEAEKQKFEYLNALAR